MATLKQLTYKALGLYTYPNQFFAPEGAMSAALDVFIDAPGCVESARTIQNHQTTGPGQTAHIGTDASATGIDFYDGTSGIATSFGNAGGGTYNVWQSFTYVNGQGATPAKFLPYLNDDTSGSLFQQRPKTSFLYNNYLFIMCGGAGAHGGYGPISRWTDADAGISANYKICWNTSQSNYTRIIARGLGCMEAPVPVLYTGTSGSGLSSLTALGAGTTWGAAATTSQRAYRVLFSYRDLNNQLIRGAPSGRYIVYNPGADFGLILFGINRLYAGDIVQVYASELQPTSASTTPAATFQEPSDDMRLVYEYIVTQSDVTAGYIVMQDIAPDDVRGAALYTNDTQEGILMAEQPPPSAAFGCWFKNVAWYGGVSTRGRREATINILGVSQWVSGTTKFTVNGVDYTSGANENVTTQTFKLYTTGSAGQNLFDTAKSICRCINYKDPTSLAIFASPPNATSATIVIRNNGQGNTSTSWTKSVSMCNPQFTWTLTGVTNNAPGNSVSPSGAASFLDSSQISWLYYSKPYQPEAVPDVNYVAVGDPSTMISGICPVRDSLFVFKPEGLYRLTGTNAQDIRVELFDKTVRFNPCAFSTIWAVGNQIFALCNQGVVSITESGVNVVSVPVQDLIIKAVDASHDINDNRVYDVIGCGSDMEKKYFLLYQNAHSALAPNNWVYCYNFVNRAWTQYTFPVTDRSCGRITCQTVNTALPDQVIFTDIATKPTVKQLITIDSAYARQSGNFVAAPSFTYCFYEKDNPGTLKRFVDVKITTKGSGPLTSVAVTMNSDSGASQSTQTVTSPYNSSVVSVEVPKDHALASYLEVKISPVSTSGTDYIRISSVQVGYYDAGDRSVR